MIVAPRAEGVESFTLDRHRDGPSELIVFISDLNGRRGGAGKLCRVTAVLKVLPPLTILEQSQNVLSGLTRAGRRLALRIDRHSKSRRSLRLRPTRLRRRTTGGQP